MKWGSMIFTKRIRNNPVRIGRLFKEKTAGGEARQPMVYQRSPGERYTFDGGAIKLNGIPVGSLINDGSIDISLWAGLASAIDEYRKEVWDKDGKHFTEFNAQAQGLLDLIGGKMLHVYE